MQKPLDKLFTYGTLIPGEVNHNVVEDLDGTWQTGSINGTLFQDGWGAQHGCPGVIPSPDGDVVPGYLLTSPELVNHWDRLDHFEGDDYQRVIVPVSLENGDSAMAYVYAIRTPKV